MMVIRTGTTSKRLLLLLLSSCFIGLAVSSDTKNDEKKNGMIEPAPLGQRFVYKADSFDSKNFEDSRWYYQYNPATKQVCYGKLTPTGSLTLDDMQPISPDGVFFSNIRPPTIVSHYFVPNDDTSNITNVALWREERHWNHDTMIHEHCRLADDPATMGHAHKTKDICDDAGCNWVDGWTFTPHVWKTPTSKYISASQRKSLNEDTYGIFDDDRVGSHYIPPKYELQIGKVDDDSADADWRSVMIWDVKSQKWITDTWGILSSAEAKREKAKREKVEAAMRLMDRASAEEKKSSFQRAEEAAYLKAKLSLLSKQQAIADTPADGPEEKKNAFVEPVLLGQRFDPKADSFEPKKFDDSQWYFQFNQATGQVWYGKKTPTGSLTLDDMEPNPPTGVFFAKERNPGTMTNYFVINKVISSPMIKLWRETKHWNHDSMIKDGWTFTEQVWKTPYSKYIPPTYELLSSKENDGTYWKCVMVWDVNGQKWIEYPSRVDGSGSRFIIYVLLLLFVIAAAIAACFYYSKKKQQPGVVPVAEVLRGAQNRYPAFSTNGMDALRDSEASKVQI